MYRERRKLLSTLPVSRTKTSYFPLRQPLSVRQVSPQQPSSLSPRRRASPRRAVTAAVRLGQRESRRFRALPKKGELLPFEVGKYFKSCVKPSEILQPTNSARKCFTSHILQLHLDFVNYCNSIFFSLFKLFFVHRRYTNIFLFQCN